MGQKGPGDNLKKGKEKTHFQNDDSVLRAIITYMKYTSTYIIIYMLTNFLMKESIYIQLC